MTKPADVNGPEPELPGTGGVMIEVGEEIARPANWQLRIQIASFVVQTLMMVIAVYGVVYVVEPRFRLDLLSEDKSRLEKDVWMLRDDLGQKLSERQQLVSKNVALDAELEQLSSMISGLKEERDALSGHLTALRQEKTDLAVKVSASQDQLRAIRETTDALRKRTSTFVIRQVISQARDFGESLYLRRWPDERSCRTPYDDRECLYINLTHVDDAPIEAFDRMTVFTAAADWWLLPANDQAELKQKMRDFILSRRSQTKTLLQGPDVSGEAAAAAHQQFAKFLKDMEDTFIGGPAR